MIKEWKRNLTKKKCKRTARANHGELLKIQEKEVNSKRVQNYGAYRNESAKTQKKVSLETYYIANRDEFLKAQEVKLNLYKATKLTIINLLKLNTKTYTQNINRTTELTISSRERGKLKMYPKLQS